METDIILQMLEKLKNKINVKHIRIIDNKIQISNDNVYWSNLNKATK